ncbi:hypothetical protein D1AOALGA4SA_8276 [Olavius algarvensis Delta 1 endosymbiont]|nr:hypothetical protein D1AOALGA4SA_8276 [Olavius algarvensis Delta 1 endosymbiont]
MTIAFDHPNTMKLLTKVARGLDLPAPGVSSQPHPAAPLTDDETVVDQQLDKNIESAAAATAADMDSEPAGNQRPLENLQADHGAGSTSGMPMAVSDPAVPKDTVAAGVEAADKSAAENAATESGLSGPVTADRSPAESSPPQLPPADSRTEKTSVEETTARVRAARFESSAHTATHHSDTTDPRFTQPGSPEAAAGLKRSIPGGPAEAPRGPGHLPADDNDSAVAENAGNPGARWQLYQAGGPGGKVSRQTSRMLQPVFDIPDQAGAPKPADNRKRENPIARDRAPATDRQPDPTPAPARAAGGEKATRPPQHHPAGRAAKREPAGKQKAVLPLDSPPPPANRPRQTASHPVTASNRQRPDRRPDRNAASVGQVEPGVARATGGPDRPAGVTAPREGPGANADGVSVGRINIQVRGQRQTEDDWPAPPQYTSHSITADWEWSCHYGK